MQRPIENPEKLSDRQREELEEAARQIEVERKKLSNDREIQEEMRS